MLIQTPLLLRGDRCGERLNLEWWQRNAGGQLMLSTAEVGSPAPSSVSASLGKRWWAQKCATCAHQMCLIKLRISMVAKMVICDLGAGTVWGRVTILRGKC